MLYRGTTILDKDRSGLTLASGQFIFRTSSIVLRSAADARRKAEPKIKQFLNLRGDASLSEGEASTQPPSEGTSGAFPVPEQTYYETSSVDSVDIIQLQADVDAQRAEISRIDSAGFQVVNSIQMAMRRVEQKVQQLHDKIESVRRDADGHRDDLRSLKSELSDVKWEGKNNSLALRLEQQLQKTDKIVAELRQGLTDVKGVLTPVDDNVSTLKRDLHLLRQENEHLKVELKETTQVARDGLDTAKEYGSEVASLRREVKQLRSELGRERSKSTGPNNPSFSAHELDILTSNISKIGNRASQIESLQMEFELFKGRVQRLETRQDSGGSRNESHDPIDQFMGQSEGVSQQRYGASNRQKRTSAGRGLDDVFSNTPPKRLAMTSDYSSAATGSYGSAARWEQSSPPAPGFTSGVDDPGPRLTKSGRVDKRTTKRGSSAGRNRRSIGTTGENEIND